MRSISDRNVLDAFCIDFCSIVEKFTDYIVVSGFVAIASGRVRGTEDIDMIIKPLFEEQTKALHQALVQAGFTCIQSDDQNTVAELLADKIAVRYVRKGTFVPEMEVKFAKDALDEYQLNNRIKLPLTGLPVWFSDVNMNIAFKEHYLKSDKDLEDAQHLRIVFAEMVDEEKIKDYCMLIDRHKP